MNQLNDASKMPFGQYKGKRIKQIPAQYILWLGSQFENSYWYDEQKQIHTYYQLNKDILEKEKNNSNPPKYYGYMTFQEYLNQGHIKRRHGVKVKREDCTQIIESHKNNKYFKKIIILTIKGEQYAYFLKYDSRLLYTMDRDHNPLSPSCFIYDDD